MSCLALSLLCTACRRASNPSGPQEPAVSGDAKALLEQMRAAYREAPAYRDQGVLRLRYRQGGTPIVDEAPFSFRAVRPNKIRLRAYGLTVACDGKQFKAKVDDKTSNNLDGQFVVRPAAETLTLQGLYSDSVLRDAVLGGMGRQPLPLELFFGDVPLEAVFPASVEKRMLPSGECDGRECRRVEAVTAEGPFVFWIDARTFVLRRLEYPVRSILPDLAAEDGADASLVADFSEASFDESQTDEDFALNAPPDAKQLRAFVLPPEPLPTALLGKEPADFSLVSLTGQRRTREQLRGKTTVLVWFQDHPACQRYLKQLDQVRQRFADNSSVQFFAVCTEPSSRSSQQIDQLSKGWGVELAVLRDLDACGRDVFAVPWAPTLVVLDCKGVVQVFEVGANPYLSEQLPVVLDRIGRGDAVAEEILADYRRDTEAYQRALTAGDAQSAAGSEEVAVMRQPRDPERVRLEPLWSFKGLSEPGNILALGEAAKTDRFVVLDRSRRLVELDLDGKQLADRRIDYTEDADYLRSAVDTSGRRHSVLTAIQGRTVTVLDEQWKAVGRYPPAEFPHQGIADVQLADADGDGRMELFVAFAGAAGVHCADLQGTRKWVNHGLPDALSLAVQPGVQDGAWELLASGRRGELLGIDKTGTGNRSVPVGRPLFRIYAGSAPEAGATCYCGVTFDPSGKVLAIGLDRQFHETWTCELPAGMFRYPVQFAASGLWTLPGQNVWLLAGADGTVHLVAADGQLRDYFAIGQDVRGLAIARRGSDSILVLAQQGEVRAMRIVPR
jgi:hypothetical protein